MKTEHLEEYVMKRLFIVAAILALLGSALAQKPAAPPARSPKAPANLDRKEAQAGEVIYLRYCAACHGRSLTGDGAVASGLINAPTDLTTMTAKNRGIFPYESVAAIIDGSKTSRIHGTPDMPVWGEIFAVTTGTGAPSAEAAVRRITHYIWSQQKKAAPVAVKK